jgi:23S rRNA (cytosine1962-C5)-methyltransferase
MICYGFALPAGEAGREDRWYVDRGSWQDYELLDCGSGEKLERWDNSCWLRPDPQPSGTAPGATPLAQGGRRYLRSQDGGGHWEKKALPES